MRELKIEHVHLAILLEKSCSFCSNMHNFTRDETEILYFYPIHQPIVNENKSILYLNGYFYGNKWSRDEIFKKEWIYSENFKISSQDYKNSLILKEFTHPLGSEAIENLEKLLSNPHQEFVKVANDFIFQYGDGGITTLHYQIYNCREFRFEENEEFIVQLEKYANHFDDWNANGIVLDIIDPDRYPEYFKSVEKALRNKYEIMKEPSSTYAEINEQGWNNGKDDYIPLEDFKKIYQNNPTNPLNIRWMYHWKPINVEISENFESVRFKNEIPGIPLDDSNEDSRKFYQNMQEIFRKMLPGFEKLNLVSREKLCELQIIIKAQKYVINPDVSYSGKWHLEGVTERIVATGVYYAHIDDGMVGGNLDFKNKVVPDIGYVAENRKDYMHAKVKINSESALVFSNDMIHRFTEIKNPTNKPCSRLFINFFIVDPKKPLPTGKKEGYHIYNEDTINTRQLIRDALVSSKNFWGAIHYGNCGEIKFVNAKIFDPEFLDEQTYFTRVEF